jgi:hypothetical protein
MVCIHKKQGGLGVINLSVHNDPMLLKFLHKFFNRAGVPSVKLIWENYYANGRLPGQCKKESFWWRDLVKLLDKFKEITTEMVLLNTLVRPISLCLQSRTMELPPDAAHLPVGASHLVPIRILRRAFRSRSPSRARACPRSGWEDFFLETGSTRHTPNASPKREYSAQSARFSSSVPVFPHPSSPVSHTPYQQPARGTHMSPSLPLLSFL